MQESFFAEWTKTKQPPFPDAVPLQELRGKIDIVSGKMLRAFAEVPKAPLSKEMQQQAKNILQVQDAVRRKAIEPILSPK